MYRYRNCYAIEAAQCDQFGSDQRDNTSRMITITKKINISTFSNETLKCNHIKRLITLTDK